MTDGFLFQIRYYTPYQEPPNGKRVLAEMFVLAQDREGGRIPAEIAAFPAPPHYSIYITHISGPPVRRSPEVLASIRQKRLAKRNQEKYPLFAEQFTNEAIAAKPEYYLDGTSREDAARNEALAEWQALYERLLAEHGKLIIYD